MEHGVKRSSFKIKFFYTIYPTGWVALAAFIFAFGFMIIGWEAGISSDSFYS